MNCPKCGSDNTRTEDSRLVSPDLVRRRRRCLSCGLGWVTHEEVSYWVEPAPKTIEKTKL